MKFRKAKQDDKEEILALYQSLIGTPYCAWGNGYPGEQEFDYDLAKQKMIDVITSGQIPDAIICGNDAVSCLFCSSTLLPAFCTITCASRSLTAAMNTSRSLCQRSMARVSIENPTVIDLFSPFFFCTALRQIHSHYFITMI